MIFLEKKLNNRRELLRDLFRSLALALMAGFGWAMTRRSLAAASANVCDRAGLCQRCNVLDHCTFPEALSIKRAGKELNHD